MWGGFNYEENLKGDKLDAGDSLIYSHIEYISSLFNRDYINKHKKDSSFEAMAKTFINTVVNESQKLSLDDTLWYICSSSIIKYKGKEQKISLTFRKRSHINGSFSLVLTGVDTRFTQLLLKDQNKEGFIPSNAHSVGFTALKRLFLKKNDAISYFYKGFRIDPLTAFFMALKEGDIEYVGSTEVTYYFTQIIGFIIEVKYKNVQSKNSGWLISKLIPSNPDHKLSFIKKLNGYK